MTKISSLNLNLNIIRDVAVLEPDSSFSCEPSSLPRFSRESWEIRKTQETENRTHETNCNKKARFEEEEEEESFKEANPRNRWRLRRRPRWSFYLFVHFYTPEVDRFSKENPEGVHSHENEWRRKKKERKGLLNSNFDKWTVFFSSYKGLAFSPPFIFLSCNIRNPGFSKMSF